jgi:hypothetical protein
MPATPKLNITRSLTQGDLNPIGMVVSSMLTEAQFQNLNGTGWVLMDGRSVAGSAYASVTGNASIPDARGMVLRGKNNSRADGNQNPAGDRALGEFEGDQMQGHHHSYFGANNTGTGSNSFTIQNNIFGPFTGAVSSPTNDGTNGPPRTGNETRMKNITLNHFIRIN